MNFTVRLLFRKDLTGSKLGEIFVPSLEQTQAGVEVQLSKKNNSSFAND
jgi:hypothetical protein